MDNNKSTKAQKRGIRKERKKKTKRDALEEQNEAENELKEGFVDLVSHSQHEFVAEDQEVLKDKENNEDNNENGSQQRQVLWPNLPSAVQTSESLMVVGPKNTGKSTLTNYLLATKNQDCVLLDCDIGKNSSLEGCVSIKFGQSVKRIWIGELTPLNNLQTYLRAINYLYNFYREEWFSRRLVINTMGYITGLGQLLIYEIFQIVKPQSVLVLNLAKNDNYQVKNIVHCLHSGQYVQKLYLSRQPHLKIHPTSTTLFSYENTRAVAKKGINRFQRHFEIGNKKVEHLTDLINILNEAQSPFIKNGLKIKSRNEMIILEQSRHGKEELKGMETVQYRVVGNEESVEMRLVVLGCMVGEQSKEDRWNNGELKATDLFEVNGLGFCFSGSIYSTVEMQGLMGVVSQGIDFQKKFYHLTEKQLIDLQLSNGRLNYLMVISKGLGAKGIRNNPAKSIL